MLKRCQILLEPWQIEWLKNRTTESISFSALIRESVSFNIILSKNVKKDRKTPKDWKLHMDRIHFEARKIAEK